ncbi:MAG: hypothetical protein M5R36_21950 [Deltaproteobacteria bacterium]|nr:hypothetical protein [Deltaproteobacteria bacterium]
MTGGVGYGGPLDRAELFDPETGLFRAVENKMRKRRFGHTATLLDDGRVLLVGGYEEGLLETLDSAEIFDPADETFTRVGSEMNFGRALHTATLLADGRVLVVGGTDGSNAFDTAEIFDPETNSYSLVEDAMGIGRFAHTATRIPDGRICVAGGLDGERTVPSATFFDPESGDFGRFDPTPEDEEEPMALGRMSHTATALPDGRIVFAGGFSGTQEGGEPTTSIEIFDFDTGTFDEAAGLTTPRSGQESVLLDDGRVLIVGGIDPQLTILSSTEIFDPDDLSVSAGPAMNIARTVARVTPLPSGSFFVSGGNGSADFFLPSPLSTAEILTPDAAAWALFPPR